MGYLAHLSFHQLQLIREQIERRLNYMLVTFVDKERPTIILKKEYDDILPLIEMTKNRGSNNILLDPNGDKTIHGRFYDYEYILTSDSPEDAVNERLAVYLDTSFNSITGKDIGK